MGLLNVASGFFSSTMASFAPYVLIGSLVLGSAGGFYAGSVWYGNKYKGELDKAHTETSLVQQRYDGFRIGALANAANQNDLVNKLKDKNLQLASDLEAARNKHLTDEKKKSDSLKKGLQNGKDSNDLSDTAIEYFRRLSGP